MKRARKIIVKSARKVGNHKKYDNVDKEINDIVKQCIGDITGSSEVCPSCEFRKKHVCLTHIPVDSRGKKVKDQLQCKYRSEFLEWAATLHVDNN